MMDNVYIVTESIFGRDYSGEFTICDMIKGVFSNYAAAKEWYSNRKKEMELFLDDSYVCQEDEEDDGTNCLNYLEFNNYTEGSDWWDGTSLVIEVYNVQDEFKPE